MYKKYNPNPISARVGDCTIRAISKLTGQSWEKVYLDLCIYGYMLCDMPSANSVWGSYLKNKGYTRHLIPDSCPMCYTVEQFTIDHPKGAYLLAISGHVVAVDSGNYYDSWDSGQEVVVYFWKKGE